jgi:hypothetical protein
MLSLVVDYCAHHRCIRPHSQPGAAAPEASLGARGSVAFLRPPTIPQRAPLKVRGLDRVTAYRVLRWLEQHGVAHRLADEERVWRFSAEEDTARPARSRIRG